MAYMVEITRFEWPRYKFLVSIDQWCDEYCNSSWWHGKNTAEYYVPCLSKYWFEDESDAFAFKLRWL